MYEAGNELKLAEVLRQYQNMKDDRRQRLLDADVKIGGQLIGYVNEQRKTMGKRRMARDLGLKYDDIVLIINEIEFRAKRIESSAKKDEAGVSLSLINYKVGNIYLKSCPRCSGDLQVIKYDGVLFKNCVQCGHDIYMEVEIKQPARNHSILLNK